MTASSFGQGDSSLQAAGGFKGLQQLAHDFYYAMETRADAAHIRAMHPTDLSESSDKLARFLTSWLGGPALYREKYGPISIPRAHAHLAIGIAERDAWLACMQEALEQQAYSCDFKAYLLRALSVPAERCRTQD
ncbi:group II truncated hemoglobin [Oceanisphaera avium]|uniref:Globin n=1 Tax=Oceanisphaera avium TaxID=1903694 RepID=A0A1Y0CU96_9GAMM|nr:group II truncated hemoglobin [Oceanisphaera avium]ART78788.1 globin [Oceanisphaera avium]